ncbi:FUSC family protein [Demequina sp. SYSU T00039]|uniref:FUSC family protein n=1 Tax=Demequina lignilytica TaxID=3051663 RepID=A0AAW7M4T3_9MICO|nr:MULTISPECIES: FUSC family protein [unclassified Demequina]MDN4479138.1 FUSC family protein [Demequina sp. SYSU T00039-1]MDN4489149.1 FUSC family protein [Demequina sp. SYSU T00039]MDN4490252.1 FUSC family protein [Demequina sp. SYSU T00068]
MGSPRTALVPPMPAVRLASTVVGVLVAVAVAVGLVAGVGAGVGAALGGLTVVMVSLMSGPRWHAVALGAAVGVIAALATLARDDALLLGVLTAVAAAVTLPVVLRYGPVCGTAPVVAAVAGTAAAEIGPWAAAVGVVVAAVAVPLALAALGLARLPATPLPRRTTAAYVAALALGSGAAIAIGSALELEHALWLVVALSAVLVPVSGETTSRARRRVIGTVLGTLAGAVLASFLPTWLGIALAVAAAVGGLAWSIAKDEIRGSAFTAAVIVLLAGAASTAGAWDAALQRIGLTVIGVVVAIALALLIARVEREEEAP